MKKNTNWIKNLIMVIIFISVITQVNIAINDGIRLAVAKYKENKINEEKMLCPPDICTVNNEENGYSKDDVDSYEVGGCLSVYKKLGESDYYYREL